jgi:hypothetical protein
MRFLNRLFDKKVVETPVKSNADFWSWFKSKEKYFYGILKDQADVENHFFKPLAEKLNQLRDGYWFLTGMKNEYLAELVITADGVVENIVFVEELVKEAPHIPGWQITALKPSIDIDEINVQMGNFAFNKENLSFYVDEDPMFPDEIDVTIVYQDYDEKSKDLITSAVFVFLDNYLGELRTVTAIDAIRIIGQAEADNDLVPIEKLKAFLVWREKEFVERYKGTRHHTEKDRYATLEGETHDGKPLIAIVNTNLLEWDRKASHPWVMVVTIQYAGDSDGLPNHETYQILNAIEDEILRDLKDFDGYLNVGRQTADNERELYFACRDFRKPSKVMDKIRDNYRDSREVKFEIYKDKYWRSFKRFTAEV